MLKFFRLWLARRRMYARTMAYNNGFNYMKRHLDYYWKGFRVPPHKIFEISNTNPDFLLGVQCAIERHNTDYDRNIRIRDRSTFS